MCFCFLKHSHANCPCKVIVQVLPQSKSCSFSSTLHGMLIYTAWASALITFLFNVKYTGTSIFYYFHTNRPAITSCIVYLSKHKCSIPSDTSLYKDEVLTLVVKVTIIPIAVFANYLFPFSLRGITLAGDMAAGIVSGNTVCFKLFMFLHCGTF